MYPARPLPSPGNLFSCCVNPIVKEGSGIAKPALKRARDPISNRLLSGAWKQSAATGIKTGRVAKITMLSSIPEEEEVDFTAIHRRSFK